MKETEKNNADAVRKKRILLVVRWPVGGIRTFMRYVYRRFDPQQYHFSILGPENPELDVLAKDLEGLDIEFFRLSEYPTAGEFFFAITKLLICGKYNLVHSHGFTSGLCAALPAFILSIPHILTSHDTLSKAQFRGFLGRIKKVVMGFALSLVNTIHSVSHDAQANLLEFFPTISNIKNKCIVIPNGIETEFFVDASPRNLRGELSLGEDVFLIGFFGRFMSLKGFIYLVDAIERFVHSGNMPKKPLVLAFGEGGFVREEKTALIARGLDQYFRFFPFTTNVASVIKGLDLIVMPSLSEACPLLPMEVLTCGIPLLSSDCIGLREVVMGTPTYVVPTKSGKHIEEGIRHFMVTAGRQIFKDFEPVAAKKFDVEDTAQAIKLLYYEHF